jgi:hypothetical protein
MMYNQKNSRLAGPKSVTPNPNRRGLSPKFKKRVLAFEKVSSNELKSLIEEKKAEVVAENNLAFHSKDTAQSQNRNITNGYIS